MPKTLTGPVGTHGKAQVADLPFGACDIVLAVLPSGTVIFSYVHQQRLSIDALPLKRNSAQPVLTQKYLRPQQGVIPSSQTLIAFEGVASLLDAKIREKTAYLLTLATVRGSLLPRPISGQLRLPEVEALSEQSPWHQRPAPRAARSCQLGAHK